MMKQTLSNKVVACIFVGLISMPMLVMLLSEPETESTSEKRNLNAWLSWNEAESLVMYFEGISDYVQDHFGFRDKMISMNTKILLAFNESPVNNVIKGKENWLFYKTHDPLLLLKLDREPLLAAIKRRAAHVSYRAKILEKQGIAYAYFVAPNKMSMYTDKMPKVYALSDNNRTYDLFSTSLDESGTPFYFDLKRHLTAEQQIPREFQFYYRNDTHWNLLGAYLAYNGIVDFVKQSHPTIELQLTDHSFVLKEKVGGDLAKFIGLGNNLKANEPDTSFLDCAMHSNLTVVSRGLTVTRCNTNKTTALLIGDSFRTNIFPYAAQSVGTLYMASQGISHKELDKIIKVAKPDIIFEEIVQRNLHKKLPY